MPNILKFKGNQSFHFLSDLIRQGFNYQELDLSEVNFITPLIVVITKLSMYKGQKIHLPIDHQAHQYLQYMSATQKYTSSYIPCYHIMHENDIWPVTKIFLGLFEHFVNPTTLRDLSYTFSELMENVFHHAQSQEGLFIHAQKYDHLGFLEVAIIDLGIGIEKSLKENPVFSNLDDMSAFIKAFEIGVTRNPMGNAGEGLTSIKWWIESNFDAEGVIISNKYMWFKILTSNKSVANFNERPFIVWPGTLIWLKIPREPKKSLLDIWESLGLTSEIRI
ncbi:MAG: hypothetical protein ABWJ99_00755 [Caldimicrobium sp.]